MADLKLDNEFGSALAGAGSKPAFANLVRFRAKEATQEEFPTTLILTEARVEVDVPLDQSSKPASGTTGGVKCFFRIANEFFATDRFVPAEGCWEGAGEIRFMLASNVVMQVKVLTTDPPEETLGYARLRLGRVGEGEFDVDGEVKRSEDVALEDETVGRIAISFKVSPNFTIQLSKLDSQYDTANIPTLINVISVDSKTLGHRMGAFQGALQILQSIITELQSQGAIGSVTAKQLGAILNQASSAQGIELFEDLLWDLAYLSFATEVFQPSLTFFPGAKAHASAAGSLQAVVDASAATTEGGREISFDKLGVLAELVRGEAC